MGKLLDGFSGELGKAWWLRVLSPAFAFWLLGALSVSGALTGPGGVASALRALKAAQGDDLWLAPLVIALMTVAASAWLVEQSTPAAIRVLEGYWPDVLGLWSRRVRTHQARRDRLSAEWEELSRSAHPTAAQVLRRTELDHRLRRYPPRERILPTRLGNVLCAAELRPLAKYGLDAVTCWPRMWLLMAKENREDLEAARTGMDDGVRLCVWSVLALLWCRWVPLVAPFAIASAATGYALSVKGACTYADLVESVFDVRRLLLYDALGWPKPKTPADEPVLGRGITKYLFRGSDDPSPRFAFGAEPRRPETGINQPTNRPLTRRPMA